MNRDVTETNFHRDTQANRSAGSPALPAGNGSATASSTVHLTHEPKHVSPIDIWAEENEHNIAARLASFPSIWQPRSAANRDAPAPQRRHEPVRNQNDRHVGGRSSAVQAGNVQDDVSESDEDTSDDEEDNC